MAKENELSGWNLNAEQEAERARLIAEGEKEAIKLVKQYVEHPELRDEKSVLRAIPEFDSRRNRSSHVPVKKQLGQIFNLDHWGQSEWRMKNRAIRRNK